MSPRYALYLAPPADSPWGEFGAQWLGRCAIRGRGGPARTTAAAIAGLDEALRAQLVAQPARYGFHATLKAPFRLRSDAVAGALIAQLDQFCSEQSGFPLPRLQPARLGNFIALVPGAADPRVDALATACVTRFPRNFVGSKSMRKNS